MFRDQSIATKLTLTIVLVSFIALVIHFAVSTAIDRRYSRAFLVDQTRTLARLAADYSVGDLAFGYKAEAEVDLDILFQLPDIEEAQIYDAEGNLFISRARPGSTPLPCPPAIASATGGCACYLEGRLEVIHPIFFRGKRHGTLRLVASTASYQSLLDARVVVLGAFSAIILGLVWFMAMAVQRWISRPVLELISKVQEIASGNLSIRAVLPSAGGELAALCRNVNQMADALESRIREVENSRRLLQSVSDNIHAAVFWKDRDFRYVWANPMFAKAAGLPSPEAIVGKTDYDLPWTREQADAFRETDHRVMAADQPVLHVIESRRTADGTEIWIDTSKVPLHDGHGAVIGLLGSYIDITRRKQAEDALQASEQNQRSMTQNARGFFLFRLAVDPGMPPQIRIVFTSPSITDIAGLDPDGEFTAWTEGVHPEDRPETTRILNETLGQGQPVDLTVRWFHRHHQEWIWLRSLANPITGEDGRITHINGICMDITEIKKTQEALAVVAAREREAAARYQALIGASNTGAWEYHADSGFLWCSPEYFSMLGRDICEFDMRGGPNLAPAWTDLLHPDDREGAWQAFTSYLKDPVGMHQQNFRMKHQDGHWVWIWSRGQTLRDENGHPTSVTVGTHIDITERIMLEERLRHGEKMEAIGQLAGGVAHDFNNQLAGILGSAELILKRIENPGIRAMAENIRQASLRAAELTRKLLAFARKGKFVSTPVNVHHLIGEVVVLLQHSIDRRITVTRHLHATPPMTVGDPTQLQSALLNLAINARDAMPAGGELTFTTARVDLNGPAAHPELPPGPYLEIGISDTGTGMSPEVQSHLFEPFFTTKEAGKGTGLGLAAVYGAIKNHGGTIRCQSAPGQGTTFHILLPLATDACPEAVVLEGTQANATGGERILLVDDEEVVRRATQEMLEALGYQVTTCRDGQEAVEWFRSSWRETDLVLLDMVMPQLGGREAWKAMHDIDPSVRVILASGYSLEGEANTLLRDGVRGFLQKPFKMGDLARLVREALQEEKPLATPPATGAPS